MMMNSNSSFGKWTSLSRRAVNFAGWQGYDFELLGETARELDLLRQALKAHREPRILVSYATIYDLSLYSSRIEQIGAEKAFYSPFIAKKNEDDGWFPDNIVPVISWIPEGETEPVAVPVTPEAKEQLQAKMKEPGKPAKPRLPSKASTSRCRSVKPS